MALIDQLHEHIEPLATLRYVNEGEGGRFTLTLLPAAAGALPATRGIYFLVSHEGTTIQKVGRTDAVNGLAQRMQGYTARYNPQDPTMALWYRVMNAELRDQTLTLFFQSFIQQTIITALGEEVRVQMSPHADLEAHFHARAIEEGHRLFLSGE